MWTLFYNIDNMLDNVERELQLLLHEEEAAAITPSSSFSFEVEELDKQCKSNSITNQNISLAELVSDMYWEVRRTPRQAAAAAAAAA